MVNELAILDHTGDTEIRWDPTKPVETEAAKAHFDVLIKKGYLAFKGGEGDDDGEQIKKFDPRCGLITMSPPHVGG